MRYACLLLLVAALAVPAKADTTWVTIGSPVRANSIPFSGLTDVAMRFQTLYLQSEIGMAGEIIAIAWMGSDDPPSPFYNFRAKLCLTGVSELSDTFDVNYGGNQPQTIIDQDTIVVGKVNDWNIYPCSVDYDNINNLLVEVQWRGSAGRDVAFMRNASGGPHRRVYASDNDTAAVGVSDDIQAYYARIGFRRSGVNEAMRLPVPSELTVKPTLGRGLFAVRLRAMTRDIRIVDVSGRTAARLDVGSDGTGSCAFWDARHVPAGVYFVEARTGEASLTRQLIVTD